jgi:hypothetical protein
MILGSCREGKTQFGGGTEKDNLNRDAIGAKIIVTAKDLDVWQEEHSTTGLR